MDSDRLASLNQEFEALRTSIIEDIFFDLKSFVVRMQIRQPSAQTVWTILLKDVSSFEYQNLEAVQLPDYFTVGWDYIDLTSVTLNETTVGGSPAIKVSFEIWATCWLDVICRVMDVTRGMRGSDAS